MENELVRFILARLDDDDRDLKKLQKAANGSPNGTFPSLERLGVENAAKREIVGVLQRLLVLRDLPAERPVREGVTEVLRRIALPYEEHAGYRAEWRPRRSGV